MNNKSYLAAIIVFVAALGFTKTGSATPDESQRLRGLGDRVFFVEVEVIASAVPDFSVGDTFPNCYFFEADGTWVDPAFPRPEEPVPGTWVQHSTGAKTAYTAFSDVGILLWQDGNVTPARGGGVLQLEAYSTVFFGDFPLATFRSIGEEVSECPL